MFEKYIASDTDLKTIEQAANIAFHPKMKFIFPTDMKTTLIASYDSKFIYVWQINPAKLILKLPHKFIIPDEWQSGWWANFISSEMKNYLSKKINIDKKSIISGGLLEPFINLQKNKNIPLNPYTTPESYIATIIHELGHVYWNQQKLWYFSSKKENLNYIKQAIDLYGFDSKSKTPKLTFKQPSPFWFSEVYAFCTEYCASTLFFSTHKNNLDKFIGKRLKKILKEEKSKDLQNKNSTIDPNTNIHDLSFVLGKIVLSKYPQTWPTILKTVSQI